MPKIKLETLIEAPIERVFDLSRSVDLHKLSTKGTNEEVIDGRTSGLIELGDMITWRAKHFGIYQNLTVKITELDKPNMFSDVMLKGAFKRMKHTHRFKNEGTKTIMIDEFEYISPLGMLGRFADFILLEKYMTKFLISKNKELKFFAESDEWKKIIKTKS